MDFKRLVNFSDLAQQHYIVCLFGGKGSTLKHMFTENYLTLS